MINTECKEVLQKDDTGFIILRENMVRKKEEGKVEGKVEGKEERKEEGKEEDILDIVIKIQEEMDTNYERYRSQYIELYGDSEYNRNYMMTDSHLYLSSDNEEDEEDMS